MSDHEQFAQVTQRKWAIVSESLRLLTKNELMSESLVFLSESLNRSFLCKRTSDSLGKPMSEFPALYSGGSVVPLTQHQLWLDPGEGHMCGSGAVVAVTFFNGSTVNLSCTCVLFCDSMMFRCRHISCDLTVDRAIYCTVYTCVMFCGGRWRCCSSDVRVGYMGSGCAVTTVTLLDWSVVTWP